MKKWSMGFARRELNDWHEGALMSVSAHRISGKRENPERQFGKA
jgi:hypothetical protein